MHELHKKTQNITNFVLAAAQQAQREASSESDVAFAQPIKWPVQCLVGPGLEGAIACESKIGFVNGSAGQLIYGGYDIFDLCAYSSYEEVVYLLMHGKLPTAKQLKAHSDHLVYCRDVPNILRTIAGFPIESMNPMSTLRFASDLMRREFTDADSEIEGMEARRVIGTDEDSIPMETKPRGEEHAIYEFKRRIPKVPRKFTGNRETVAGYRACYRLISGLATVTAGISRIRQGHFPLDPRSDLSHAGNLLYMITGRVPSPEEERIMDIALILHADHGMNASTFAAMVVASTLSDIYSSVGAGIAALSGPLHGGANEQVIKMLAEIGSPKRIDTWYEQARARKQRIMGFGHRVYKAYDPRARILRPLAQYLANKNSKAMSLFSIAGALEEKVIATLGKEKNIFPNVDFYSGIVYNALGISADMFTPIFAVSRVAGWTARVIEYLQNNRIFRPRAMYVGPFGKKYPLPGERS